MHRGELGAGNLNRLLQEALTAGAPGIERGQRTLRVGDKVMQVKNDYDKEVWNGDSGTVEGVGDETLAVRFDDRLVEYSARRAGHAGARLRGHRPQVTGVGVPGGGRSPCTRSTT